MYLFENKRKTEIKANTFSNKDWANGFSAVVCEHRKDGLQTMIKSKSFLNLYSFNKLKISHSHKITRFYYDRFLFLEFNECDEHYSIQLEREARHGRNQCGSPKALYRVRFQKVPHEHLLEILKNGMLGNGIQL